MTAQNPAGCSRLSKIRQAAAEAICVSRQYYHFQCMTLKLLCLQQDKLEMSFKRSLICVSSAVVGGSPPCFLLWACPECICPASCGSRSCRQLQPPTVLWSFMLAMCPFSLLLQCPFSRTRLSSTIKCIS